MDITDTTNLIEKIKIFNDTRIKNSSFSHLVDAGLNVFLFSNKISFASFYLLNEEDFEFNHYNTLPNNLVDDAKALFDELIDKGIVGSVLSNAKMVNDAKNKYLDNKYHCLSIPVIKSQGVLGLVLLAYNIETDFGSNSELFEIIELFSHNFAVVLENAINIQKLNKNKEIFDQQVAYRTMKLVESQKQLADKFDYLRSNLSMSIPHEVRTPINQILGFSDFLMKYYKTTELDEALDMLTDIHDSALRLNDLFENYIYYANLSIVATNVYEIMKLQQLVTPSLSAVLDDAVYALSDKFDRKDDIKIDVEDCSLAIAEDYLKKTIDEILSNSLKYSEKSTFIEIKAHKIEKENIGGMCEISFTDYGSGMPPEQVKNIDAYMQFDRKIQEQQGSGLGLSIVQRIIDLHNGFIEFKSEIGKFTTVIIQLPITNSIED